MHYESWCSLSDEQLARRDIAEVNLAAAAGLRGSEDLDIAACVRQIDQWTEFVRLRTEAALGNWHDIPEYCDFSESKYRALAVSFALLRLGLKFNFAANEGNYDTGDSRNLFINGPLTGHLATCACAPVLYAAVGRRLAYPIKLVKARCHLFCRWDDPNGERFNIEATTPGFSSYSDKHYRSWPIPIKDWQVESGWLLRSLSPREELALFLGQRGNCLLENLETERAMEAYDWSCRLDRKDVGVNSAWAIATMLHDALQEPLRRHSPSELALAPPYIPAPREVWEKIYYRRAQAQLHRILSRFRESREAHPDQYIVSEIATPA